MLVLVDVSQRLVSLIAALLMQITHWILAQLLVASCIFLVLEEATGDWFVTALGAIASGRKVRLTVIKLALRNLLAADENALFY